MMNERGAAQREARIAWRRLWPPTIGYGAASATLLFFAVQRHGLLACLPWLAAGAVLWTWVEYVGHRFVLHGVVPDGRSPWRRFRLRRLVQLHWHHHAEPWNGRHIGASLGDTAAVVLSLAVLASVLPQPAGLVAFASFLLSYLMQEWVHLSASGAWDRVYGTHMPRLAFRRAFASSSVLLLAPTRTPGRLHVAGVPPSGS